MEREGLAQGLGARLFRFELVLGQTKVIKSLGSRSADPHHFLEEWVARA